MENRLAKLIHGSDTKSDTKFRKKTCIHVKRICQIYLHVITKGLNGSLNDNEIDSEEFH